MDREIWWATVPGGEESGMTERLKTTVVIWHMASLLYAHYFIYFKHSALCGNKSANATTNDFIL